MSKVERPCVRQRESNAERPWDRGLFGVCMRGYRGTQRQFSGKYLFGRRFEIWNFRSICCKISCLPASPRIFEHLQNGIIIHF